jgi:ABC-2 type transport system permease protein
MTTIANAATIANVAAVARREYTTRVRTRSFIAGTVLLVVSVVAIALLPVIVGYLDRTDTVKAAVHVSATDLATDPAATLSALLNARPDGTTPPSGQADFVVTSVPDLAAARQAVLDGTYSGVLEIARGPEGDLVFTLYTNGNANGREGAVVRQAATSIAVADRLARAGVAPAEQANVFVPPAFQVAWPDPARTDPTPGTTALIGQNMLGFGMTILIFMMIILYGQWIAMSVVEEKSSRVMEVILNAATPFQLLAGKVLGVGAVAGTQYLALLLAGGGALLAQDAIAQAVLGTGGASGVLPQGLTIELLLLFGVYGVLGFLLFAVLYAAAGSLVSRQEDVNSIVLPMTLIATAGYMVAIYASLGVIDIQTGWIVALAQVPLVSPFMMLARVTAQDATIWEVLLSIALLSVAIIGALWLAARVYAAGVLLYGQRPSAREVWRLVRSGA